MRRFLLAGSLTGIAVLSVLWFGRGWIRDAIYAAQQPKLPIAQPFVTDPVDIVSIKAATTTQRNSLNKKKIIPVPQKITAKIINDPLVWKGPLPTSTNLAVPFLLQAPKSNWAMPYQETCEEAAVIMVDAFYRGRVERFGQDDGDRAILRAIAFEKKMYGKYEDTTAEETAMFIRDYFGYKQVFVREIKQADDLRKVMALGYPVIVPAAGKLLKNPYFRNGGPIYHMLVVKGYTEDGRFITNDPGIGRGPNYLYRADVLMDAIHDWNDGNVQQGKKKMIVILP